MMTSTAESTAESKANKKRRATTSVKNTDNTNEQAQRTIATGTCTASVAK
jgi:hypothetical protein